MDHNMLVFSKVLMSLRMSHTPHEPTVIPTLTHVYGIISYPDVPHNTGLRIKCGLRTWGMPLVLKILPQGIHAHTHIHTCTCAYTQHTRTHTRTYIRTYTCIHTHTRIHTRTYMCTHTIVNKYIHTCTHTHTHTHTHLAKLSSSVRVTTARPREMRYFCKEPC